MENYSQQSAYTIDEIRTKFASRRAFDWDCAEYGPFFDEPITWTQWYEAFPPPKPDLLPPAESETFDLKSIPDLDPTVWTPCIFDAHTLPAAAYLDPDGWKQIMKLERRNYKHWQKFCPNTYAVATALFDGLGQRDLWGYHLGKKKWVTVTAGLKPKDKIQGKEQQDKKPKLPLDESGQPGPKQKDDKSTRHWADKPITLIDVLNALGNPDKNALGSTDARLKVYECKEIWRHPFYVTRVNRLQIDVDMDRAWDWCHHDLEEVADEISREVTLIKSLGLTPHFFKTGGRGHQIVIPTPTLDRSVASLLVLMIRYLLAEGKTLKKKPRYKPRYKRLEVDKSNLECLVRLPLGRHAETKAVGWMIAPDNITILPPDQQAEAVARAWNYTGHGCEILEASKEALATALDGMYYDRDMTVCGSTDNEERFEALAEIVTSITDCPILHAFHTTCDAWNIPSLWHKSMGTVSSESETVSVESQHLQSQPTHDVFGDVSGALSSKVGVALPVTASNQAVRDSVSPTSVSPTNAIRPQVKLGKGWAKQVLDEGFEPGGFFTWSQASGKNGIGAAILYCDGDRDQAEKLLSGMANKVDCRSEEERQKRIEWIKWAVPSNNIDTHYERPELSKHRDLQGVVLETETELAHRVVEELVSRRRDSQLQRRVFTTKSLTTLQHIVELVQMEARNSKDEFVRVSARTLAAEIAARWPEDATDGKDVSRQMEWITRELPRQIRRIAVAPAVASNKNKCLFCLLEQLPTSRRAFDAKGYVLGSDFIAMLPLDELFPSQV